MILCYSRSSSLTQGFKLIVIEMTFQGFKYVFYKYVYVSRATASNDKSHD